MTKKTNRPEHDRSGGLAAEAGDWESADTNLTALDEAYRAVRAHLHQPLQTTDEVRDQLRSLLWLCASAVERQGHRGMVLRELGDELAGTPPMTDRIRAILEIQAHAYRKEARR